MERGEEMGEIYRLRDALEVARQTIDLLRTSEGTKPCPKECGDCLGVETGCYIIRAIGVINRALDGSRENEEEEEKVRGYTTSESRTKLRSSNG